MYRQDGEIPIINANRYPKRLIVFDTEAYRSPPVDGIELQTFRLAVLHSMTLDKNLNITDDEYYYCADNKALFAYIDNFTRKDCTTYVYAHNIKYDLQLSGLLTFMLEAGYKVGTFVFSDPPTFVRLTRNRTTIMFVDTFNYWQTSLSKLGDQLNLPKLQMPDDIEDNLKWFVYCKRDVEVLSQYILDFMHYLKDNNLCGLGLTLASQSFRTFRHRFMSTPIIIHNRKEAISIERQAYSGGRVEAYHIGKLPTQTYYKLDVNSMYPFVMKDNDYPVEFVAYGENVDITRVIALSQQYYLIGIIELDTDQPVYAYKDKHKLIFPIGHFITALHQSEIIYAVTHGHFISALKLAAYRKGPVFSDYVDFFYRMKLRAEDDHNPVIRHQAKIMMNSLYGKFGQQEVISKVVPNVTGFKYGRFTGYSEALGKRVEVNCLGADMELSYKQGESVYSFPGIAGAVTAYARLYLWDLLQIAKVENCFYLDTDSLVVNQEGYDRLASYLDNTKLGYLKLEDTSDSFTIWGAKDYQFGADIKHKGVPKSAKELAVGSWQYEQFRGANTWLADGLDTGVKVYTRTKQRISGYDKGIVNPDRSVSPLVLR